MLQLNDNTPIEDGHHLDRRNFLRIGGLTLGGLSLGQFMSLRAATPHIISKAQSVIYISLDGGPCHLDTFDPKPKAPIDYTGPYKTPVNSNVDGIQLCEKLPLLATIADKYTLIRSMSHGIFGHETAQYVTQTGAALGSAIAYPSFGATIAYMKESNYKGSCPPFITIPNSASRFNEAGFLGPDYTAFATGGSPESPNFVADGIGTGSITVEHITQRKSLLESIDSFSKAFQSQEILSRMDLFTQKAWSLILGNSKDAFNLNKESDKTRERYGKNRLGQSCLLARRLVEQGVPVITVRSGGWDTHKQHFERMDEKLPELDKALSALISDLSERGLLKNTIVICGGEFGRTPKILYEPPWNGGRNHFGTAFSYLVAGGGFTGGKVLGATDFRGETVTERPVHPSELIATIYQLLGIDFTASLPHPYLGTARILPEWGKKGMGVLNEIIA